MTRLVVISGLSGSGKTQALRSLEDMGYFAVDNLPILLIPSFVELLARGPVLQPSGVVVVDVRERHNLAHLPEIVADLRRRPDVELTLLFLEAHEEVLLRRFSETRRPHPLAPAGEMSVAEAVRAEVALLTELRGVADRVIPTDDMSPHELRRVIKESLPGGPRAAGLHCQVVSFGFKYGIPRDADMVFDARFLTNPFFKPDLRPLDGRDAAVRAFLEALPDYHAFARHLEGLMTFVMPRFVAEGKSYLTVAVGCTGGRHRSVALAERLRAHLAAEGFSASVAHRDIGRESSGGNR